MEIILNGKIVEIEEDSLATIISQHKISPNNCIVEINGRFVERDNFSITKLREGDRLELIRFIGGG